MHLLDLVIAAQLLFGLGFPIVGAILLRAIVRRRRFAGRAWGKVASVSGSVAAVRFVSAERDEELLVQVDAPRSRERAPLRPGSSVRVLYDVADPDRAMIDSDLSWGVLTTVWLLGIGTLIEILSLATLALTLRG